MRFFCGVFGPSGRGGGRQALARPTAGSLPPPLLPAAAARPPACRCWCFLPPPRDRRLVAAGAAGGPPTADAYSPPVLLTGRARPPSVRCRYRQPPAHARRLFAAVASGRPRTASCGRPSSRSPAMAAPRGCRCEVALGRLVGGSRRQPPPFAYLPLGRGHHHRAGPPLAAKAEPAPLLEAPIGEALFDANHYVACCRPGGWGCRRAAALWFWGCC